MSPIPAMYQDLPANQEDPFEGSSEPLMYMSENRMPVMIEFNNTLIYIVFSALVLALLSILPGIRRTKFNSLLGLLTLLTLGASILLALQGSSWLKGSLKLENVQYSALTRETLTGRLEVNIGLSWVNVSLSGRLAESDKEGFVYNERFSWSNPERMLEEHQEALRRGLPYPILTVTEFLSQDTDGFNWSRQLRQAGYYSSMALYLSLAGWALTSVVMCLVPVYLPHMLQITGTLVMFSVWIYTYLVQSPNLYAIQVGGNELQVAFGASYVTTFVSGALSMLAGLILMVIQLNMPQDKQLTIMDSESFTNDHKALHSASFLGHQLKSGDKSSVIIPIKDIEDNFHKPAAQAAPSKA